MRRLHISLSTWKETTWLFAFYIYYGDESKPFVCLFFYQLCEPETKQKLNAEREGKRRKEQHAGNNEAKCVDDDLVSFLSLLSLSLPVGSAVS